MGRLYIELYHGRTDPDEQMDDWGFSGPVLGPFEFIHHTYLSHIRVGYRGECYDLPLHDDMVEYRGNYYGDWTILGTNVPAYLKSRQEPMAKTMQVLELF